jgi:hypothetical protein
MQSLSERTLLPVEATAAITGMWQTKVILQRTSKERWYKNGKCMTISFMFTKSVTESGFFVTENVKLS